MRHPVSGRHLTRCETRIRTHTAKAAHRLVRRFSKVKWCQVLLPLENATVTLSRATDWILVVGQWPVLDPWLKQPRSVAGVRHPVSGRHLTRCETRIRTHTATHTVKAAHKLVRRFSGATRCQVLLPLENATVTLSRATDWILVVGQWPVCLTPSQWPVPQRDPLGCYCRVLLKASTQWL